MGVRNHLFHRMLCIMMFAVLQRAGGCWANAAQPQTAAVIVLNCSDISKCHAAATSNFQCSLKAKNRRAPCWRFSLKGDELTFMYVTFTCAALVLFFKFLFGLSKKIIGRYLLLSLRWLQPQSVQGHQQCALHGARMFWLRGRLPVGGRAAHRAPQPGRTEHAQWSRHGAARPVCGGYFPQWQTLNVKSTTCLKKHTHTHTQICSV